MDLIIVGRRFLEIENHILKLEPYVIVAIIENIALLAIPKYYMKQEIYRNHRFVIAIEHIFSKDWWRDHGIQSKRPT